MSPFRQFTSGMYGRGFHSMGRSMMTTPIYQNLWVLENYHELGDYHEWVLEAYLGRYLKANNV